MWIDKLVLATLVLALLFLQRRSNPLLVLWTFSLWLTFVLAAVYPGGTPPSWLVEADFLLDTAHLMGWWSVTVEKLNFYLLHHMAVLKDTGAIATVHRLTKGGIFRDIWIFAVVLSLAIIAVGVWFIGDATGAWNSGSWSTKSILYPIAMAGVVMGGLSNILARRASWTTGVLMDGKPPDHVVGDAPRVVVKTERERWRRILVSRFVGTVLQTIVWIVLLVFWANDSAADGWDALTGPIYYVSFTLYFLLYLYELVDGVVHRHDIHHTPSASTRVQMMKNASCFKNCCQKSEPAEVDLENVPLAAHDEHANHHQVDVNASVYPSPSAPISAY